MPVAKHSILLTTATLLLALIGWFGESSAPLRAAQTPAATPQPAIGRLRFVDNETARTGSVDLQIDAIQPPPAGAHYELWLRSNSGAPLLKLGNLKVVAQKIEFTGDAKQPLLNLYDTALLSLQADNATGFSQQIILSGTLPSALLTPLRQLFFPDSHNDKGFLSGGVEQIEIGVKHAGFLQDAVNSNDLTKAQLHGEHIVNLLDGKTGSNFSDLNRNGRIDNPGDGFGVRAYIEESERQVITVSNALSITPGLQDLQKQTQTTLAALNEGHKLVLDGEEKAMKVFDVDSTAEAQTFVGELGPILEQANLDMTNATKAMLQIAEIRFYGKPALPKSFAPASPLTTTVVASSTSAPTTTMQSVHFVEPMNGAIVPPRFAVKMAVTGLIIEPAGKIRTGAGHLHILVDTDFVAPGDVIINDDKHKHFGKGELAAILELKPGVHILRLQFGNGAHVALAGPQYRDTITIGVSPTITGSLTPTTTWSVTAAVTQTAAVTETATATPALSSPSVEITSTATISPGEIWTNPVDGAEYVYVPGGEFTIGAEEYEAASPLEQPEHKVTVDGFWLQRTEVTNAEYAKCVADKACTPPNNQRWQNPEFAQHPVTHVSWNQANTYAAWAGGRLPSEAEWEKGCRSTDGRLYPWGEAAPTSKLANYNNEIGDTTPVGSYPDGASPYGAFDMAGNVWEWTSSIEKPYPYNAKDGREDPKAPGKRILRGGSYYYTQYQLHCTTRSGFTPTTANQHFGFRVAITDRITLWKNPVDGAEYVYVPGGEFTMGAEEYEAASPLEQPEHKVTVNGFWLQRTEVTNAEYAKCVADKACTPPNNQRWQNPEFTQHPVTHVSWAQANAYATWAGGRLPSEAEWEKGCRSTDGRLYPWGEAAPTSKLANYNNEIGDTTPVGSYPDGASPYGAFDMAGNVWEWTSSIEKPYPYNAKDGREDLKAPGKRILRGGSFYYTQYQLHCTTRSGFTPTTANQHFGFRVIVATPGGQK